MMQRIVYWLIVYDMWCEGRVKALLTWLQEWFSISQKHIEEGMIVLYMGLLMPSWKWKLPWLCVNIFIALFVGSTMIWLHRKPETSRGTAKYYPELRVLRVMFQAICLLLCSVFLLAPPHRITDRYCAIAQIVYLVFFYMTDINSNGKPGRRRKLALAELKKLFGAAWIPKPALEPE